MAKIKAPKKTAAKRRGSGNVVLGPVITKKVRVPINAAVYAKKESELAQLEVEVRKINRKIKPDKDQIRLHRQKIIELTGDIENNTEERELSVREEFHFNTSNIRVLDARTKKVIEERTMSKQERTRQTDVEDEPKDDDMPPGAGQAMKDFEAGYDGDPEERAES